jgi:hypothetical protein
MRLFGYGVPFTMAFALGFSPAEATSQPSPKRAESAKKLFQASVEENSVPGLYEGPAARRCNRLL